MRTINGRYDNDDDDDDDDDESDSVKFCPHIQRIDWNKSPLKISEK